MKENSTGQTPFEKKLISWVKAIPEDSAPQDLAMNIMIGLTEPEPSFFEKLTDIFNHRVSISFSPVKAMGLVFLFLVGIISYQHSFSPLKSIQDTPSRGPVYPASYSPNFLVGKTLFSEGVFEKSIAYLNQAVEMEPGQAEYHFWLGMNQGNLNEFQKERNSYLKAISLDPDHLMSYFFLGHNFMSSQKWEMAIDAYGKVLSKNPSFEQAIYNRGLALKNIGRTQDAIAAWKEYLSVKQTGLWAIRAARHLNAAGDFSYRPYQIGKQRLILGPFSNSLEEISTTISSDALGKLARSLTLNPDIDLYIITYSDNDQKMAEDRAKSIKNKLLTAFPDIDPTRIRLSWFGTIEEIRSGNKSFSLKQSVRFLGIQKEIFNRGVNT